MFPKKHASEIVRRIRANARRYRLRNRDKIKEYHKRYYLEVLKPKRALQKKPKILKPKRVLVKRVKQGRRKYVYACFGKASKESLIWDGKNLPFPNMKDSQRDCKTTICQYCKREYPYRQQIRKYIKISKLEETSGGAGGESGGIGGSAGAVSLFP